MLAPGLEARGFDLLVATLRTRGRYFQELRSAGIETVHVGMKSRFNVRAAVRAFGLRRSRPTIVLSQSLDAQVLGHAIAWRAGAAHVTTEHGGPGLERSLHRRALTRLVAPRVDRVVAVSHSQIPELLRLGYRRAAIRVLPNGPPEPTVTRLRADVRRELGLAEEDVVVLLVAALRPEKRAKLFVDAIALARQRNPRVRGVIAGGGPLLEEIRRSAQAVGDGVVVLGERSDVPDLINAADAVGLTSDVEGMPLAALEAMSLGRPVIATDVGGMRDLVDHAHTGLLVPRAHPRAFSEAILELAENPPLRSRMGSAARARYLTSFTAELMIDRYAELLRELGRPTDAAA